jgi:hypothetical protein
MMEDLLPVVKAQGVALAEIKALLTQPIADTQPAKEDPPAKEAYVVPGPTYGYHGSESRKAAVKFAQKQSKMPRGTGIGKCIKAGGVTQAQILAHINGMDRGQPSK